MHGSGGGLFKVVGESGFSFSATSTPFFGAYVLRFVGSGEKELVEEPVTGPTTGVSSLSDPPSYFGEDEISASSTIIVSRPDAFVSTYFDVKSSSSSSEDSASDEDSLSELISFQSCRRW